jgi:thiol:disulfide interchange protein DsbC
MKTPHTLLAAALALGLSFSAAAQTPDSIKAELKKRFPDLPTESVKKTPYGLYEVIGGGEIFYTDEKASFLIANGQLVDAKTRENLTEARMRQLTAVRFDQLPLDAAIKIVRGNGSRKVALFEDPNCGYCKHFERELATVNDVTVYVFLFPILSPDSAEKSKAVWCSTDRAKAWLDLMLKDTTPAPAGDKCEAPLEKTLAFGRDKRITGTPTMFFEDGERVPGAMPRAALEKRLADARAAVAKAAPVAKK